MKNPKLKLLATVLPSRMDDIHLKHHIIVHEVGQRTLVGDDAAYLGGTEENVLGLLSGEERLYLVLTAEVELGMSTGDDIAISLALELTHNGATYHAAVASYVDF